MMWYPIPLPQENTFMKKVSSMGKHCVWGKYSRKIRKINEKSGTPQIPKIVVGPDHIDVSALLMCYNLVLLLNLVLFDELLEKNLSRNAEKTHFLR
jgi:hypothetical protein